MTDEATTLIHKPTFWQRLWSRLGFGSRWDEELFEWRSADPQPDDWFVPGTLTMRTMTHVGWRDRLRLLISGRCEVCTYTRTDALVHRAETRAQFSVLSPAWHHPGE